MLPNTFCSSFRPLVRYHFLREAFPDSPHCVRFPCYRLPDNTYFSASAQHSCTFVLVSSMPVSSAPVTISDRSLSQVHAHCAPGYLLNTYIELMSTASPKCTWPGRSDPSPMLVTYISCCKFVTFAQMIHRHLKLCTFRASPSPPLLFLFQETAKKRKTKKERAVPSTQLLPVPPKTYTHTHPYWARLRFPFSCSQSCAITKFCSFTSKVSSLLCSDSSYSNCHLSSP